MTWTCYPYTTYYDSPAKSLATFTWTISGSPSAYKVSSTSNPFSLSFKNAPLTLLDEGLFNERYRFQISTTKTVSPATNLTEDNAAVDCDFRGNLQANLYTKMGKEYPGDQDPSGDPSYPTWPFAMKIEESAPGGVGVPSCYKTGGKDGQRVTRWAGWRRRISLRCVRACIRIGIRRRRGGLVTSATKARWMVCVCACVCVGLYVLCIY